MHCQTCGEELREGARFCPTCGTPTATAGGAVTPPTVQIRRSAGDPSADEAATERAPADAGQEADYAAEGEPADRTAAPRVARDPGAGYDPVGPPRAAPRSVSAGQSRRPSAGVVRAAGGTPAFASVRSDDFSRLFGRLGRLLRLDTSVFGEIYSDTAATIPAAVVAVAALIISGLGAMLFIESFIGFDVYELGDGSGAGGFFLTSVLLGTLLALALLVGWAWLTTLLLKQLAGVDAEVLGIVRVLGIALVPLALGILLFFDEGFLALSWIALGGVLSLAVIGVLESVEVRPGHAWLATIAGFAVWVIVLQFLGDETRDLAPGFFALI